jgi:hypothetical protein
VRKGTRSFCGIQKGPGLCDSQLVSHVTVQMSAQTLGDVAVLGERRLIESFAFPVENKSFAQLLDISGRVIGLAVRSQWVTMAGKSSRSPICTRK